MKTLSEEMLATEELEDFSLFSIYENGDKIWRDRDNNFHREDGPAIEYAVGHKSWYQHGYLHREDGPAIESINGYEFWYLKDKLVSETDVRALGKMKGKDERIR